MEIIKKYIIVLVLLLNCMLFANTNSSTENCCVGSTTSYTYGAGGYKLPSIGELNVLIVFAEFSDDNYLTTDSRWITEQAPNDMNNWVDQTWSTNPTQGSLTHYFNDMSGNKFKFIGKELHIVTNKTRAEYKTLGWERFDIHEELLQTIDITENFSDYDNWTRNSDYSFTNTADDKIDMVIFVWRNIDGDTSIDYSSDLDFGNNYGDLGSRGDIWVDSSQRYISTSTWGSGVTVRSYFGQDPFRIALHEFNHYLLGHNDMHNGYGYWGMLADWGTKSYTANAFEMYQLQWANSVNDYTIDATNSTVQTITKTLGDFLTTNEAIRIKYDTDKYFYIENHQKSSWWESHAPFSSHPNSIDGTIENGVYIIRQEGLAGANRQCIPADGRNDWVVVDNIVNPYDANKILPVWRNYGADKVNGHHSLEKVYHNYPGCTESTSAIYFVKNPVSGVIEEPKYFLGTGTHAFRNEYQEIFSPWSNPNNQKSNGSTVDFALSTTISSGTATITIYKNNPSEAAPSKPQNLQVTSVNNHPKLTWDANTEPDILSYKIYRKENNSRWEYIGSATKLRPKFTDNDVESNYSHDDYYYKVLARDNQGKESVYSNEVSITGLMAKYAEQTKEKEIPSEYFVAQNFPNPFNPTTTISYQLPKASNVILKIYDVLGKEVAELVNENKSAGKYNVSFDANNLPSGLYFYKIQAGEFTETRKMLLMK
ncbi:MAG: T9SS type A sorting domain-containing protein [Ignavibacteriae bacterium]|nr:T9SS type A sorting domain-containing protein [Ignavibacteriota bacterium]